MLASKFMRQYTMKVFTESENTYFCLNLMIPKLYSYDRALVRKESTLVEKELPRFNFIKKLEESFKRDLKKNNPWFNPDVIKNYFRKGSKKVRFMTTEINFKNPQLPNCRKNYLIYKPGKLHAPHCKNSTEEDVHVIGDHTYQNRVFILNDLERRIKVTTI